MYNLIKIILFFLHTNRCNLIKNKLDIINFRFRVCGAYCGPG